MDKTLFSAILQVGIVVDNIEASMDRWREYGFTTWSDIIPVDENTSPDTRQFGEPLVYSTKIAMCDDLAVQIELIEPVSGDSIYRRFLKEHGPGIHHLILETRDGEFGKTVEFVDQRCKGEVMIQGGDPDLQFRYYDLEKDLGFVAEFFGDLNE
ncbi:MAG: VOC family protein [Coriobacteriales bacterium]|jgi:methylmalonyl-CoA/ethylmalonyl-CoA epimerase|nr:VOC family protein [Coriobacteriales bacterium]